MLDLLCNFVKTEKAEYETHFFFFFFSHPAGQLEEFAHHFTTL